MFRWGRARQRIQGHSSSICQRGNEKGYMHCSWHGNIDYLRLWNPEWVTSSGRKAPTPVLLWGSAKTLETDQGPSIIVTGWGFLFWPGMPLMGPWSCILTLGAF
jgi:hypothetical protein